MASPAARGAPRFVDREMLTTCVHCGLCLPACPTYLELGREADSPRGRLYLMKAVEEGTLPLTGDIVRHLDLCLGCRACEVACPSGVPYGGLIEAARASVETTFLRPWRERWRRKMAVEVFPHPGRLRALLTPVRVMQKLRLWRLARGLVPAASLVPELRPFRRLPEVSPAEGAERARVGLLAGCVTRVLFERTNRATVRVLTRNGVTVVTPRRQGCCGALHLHAGDPQTARLFARSLIDAFPADLDAVLSTAAGCGAMMKEYERLLSGDGIYAERARGFVARVRDVTEFLADLPVAAPRQRISARVTYHDACHLLHVQEVQAAPRLLLSLIPGLDLVELPESDVCCGSAGSYSLTEPEMARRLLGRKIANIEATGARVVAAANAGCALHIEAGLRARGLDIAVVHPVELLAEAYGVGDGRGVIASASTRRGGRR